MAASRLFDDAMPRRWDAAVPVDGVDGSTDSADGVGRLYDRFAAGLYRYALIVLADPDGAADVIQQVFTAIVARQGRKEALKDGERYLRRSVRNECFSHLRARSRRPAISDAPLLEAVAPEVDPAERIAIEQALPVLPADQREVIHLKVFEGMTFQEIADMTGESINTIGSRYRYAIDKLRALPLAAAAGSSSLRSRVTSVDICGRTRPPILLAECSSAS